MQTPSQATSPHPLESPLHYRQALWGHSLQWDRPCGDTPCIGTRPVGTRPALGTFLIVGMFPAVEHTLRGHTLPRGDRSRADPIWLIWFLRVSGSTFAQRS